MNFRQWIENDVVPIGDCFRFANKLGVKMLANNAPEDDLFVVHATVSPKWHHRPYPHAWVESQGLCYDWQMNTTGVNSMPMLNFYKEYKPKNIQKYHPAKAVGHMISSGHHGPWN
jgi:hypothetical protein